MSVPPRRMNPIAAATDEQIREAVGRLGQHGASFTTVDVIGAITGAYLVDAGTPPGASDNAQFGKRLSENALAYGIVREPPKELPTSDDRGSPTTTAKWRRSP